jgi:NitT/TauT family transport system substrate-binding protein
MMTRSSRARMLGLLAVAPAALYARRAAAQQQSAPLRIATAVGDSYASPYFTADGGFLAKAGLSAEITLLNNGSAVMAAVAGGTVDIGLSDAIQLANAYNRGIPFKFFAGGGLYTTSAPTTVMCVGKSSPIRAPKDLEGQTIAMLALSSVTEIAVREWMKNNGVDQTKVKLFEMPGSDIPGALARGTVGAGVIVEPVLTAALTSGDVRAFAKPFDAVAKQFYISSWFARGEWLAKNPDVAKKLTAAIYDAARWANANHDQSGAILAKYAKLDPDRIKSMTRVQMATVLDAKFMQPVLDGAVAYKLIAKPTSAADLMAPV